VEFSFSEEQQAAVEAARAVFSGVAADSVPSPALAAGAVAEDFDRPLWRGLADADLLSLVLDESYGGSGLDPVALCLILREAGAVLARVPLLETCAAALTIQRHAPAGLRDRLLPEVARGELVLTVASGGRTGHDPAELAVTARRDGSAWVLDGTHTAVPWAQHADRILIPAVTPDGHPVIAVLPRDAAVLSDQISTSGERFAEVRLDAVRVPHEDLITADGAWDWLRRLLTTGTCALALGLGTTVLRLTAEYTGRREQFGHPIATFQAVAMQVADRYTDLRAMEVTLWQAAWRLEPAAVAVAKIWASDGVRRVVQTAQHLHGGFGADTDYVLHRYHAWAKQLELSLGPAALHEEALGDLLAAEA
jgi:alkylation response protein AidB-like acyl-CoA dehydrogenase